MVEKNNSRTLLTLDYLLVDTKTRSREKLELVASFSLFGNVMSMASVQLIGSSRDALLLSFKDAKVLLCNMDTAQANELIFTDLCVCLLSPVVCGRV